MARDYETEKKLIDAANFIGQFVSKNLPADWEIILTINSKESSIELIDPDGEEVEYYSEVDVSTISGMCNNANEEDILGDAE